MFRIAVVMVAIRQYVAKLDRRTTLPETERNLLSSVPGFFRDHATGETIIADETASKFCIIVESGFVSRVRKLRSGARQIVAFHLPGDAVDLQSLLFKVTDHKIEAHCPTRTFWIAHRDLWDITENSRLLNKAFWLDTLVDASIFREWTANIGQRRARARIGHLFLELIERFEAIGMVDANSFICPLTQTAFATALGLSLVHFNKSLQTLRHDGFISTRNGSITISRRDDLATLTGFNPDYLHLNGERIVNLENLAQR